MNADDNRNEMKLVPMLNTMLILLSMRQNQFLILLLMLQQSSVTAGFEVNLSIERAYILSGYKQLVTSSALGWADIDDIQSGKICRENVVVKGENAICRIRKGHKIIPGRTDKSGQCIIGSSKLDNYQVLVSLGGLARYEWKDWDMFKRPHVGTVAFNEKTFVGCIENDIGEDFIGELDLNSGMNGEISTALSSNGRLIRLTHGKSLVEIEPISYQLENIILDTEREKITREKMKIEELQFSHEHINNDYDFQTHEEDWQQQTRTVNFAYKNIQHWGTIPGASKGMKCRVVFNGRSFVINWGLEYSEDVVKDINVESRLQQGTGMSLGVFGEKVWRTVPYNATLVQVYRDGRVSRNDISSVFTSESVENMSQTPVKAPFYLDTGLPAPTTTTTSTTSHPPTSTEKAKLPSANHLVQNWTPTSSSTLFPPPPPTVAKANPLRKFYPDNRVGWESHGEDMETLPPRLAENVLMDSLPLNSKSSIKIGAFKIIPILVMLLYFCQSLL